uniref:Uncharacterized protein n=1 Tax=Zea mays TaxID=4577 RepID=C0PLC4_MAIZE|nr:unknown [Zea mays]
MYSLQHYQHTTDNCPNTTDVMRGTLILCCRACGHVSRGSWGRWFRSLIFLVSCSLGSRVSRVSRHGLLYQSKPLPVNIIYVLFLVQFDFITTEAWQGDIPASFCM